MTKRITKIHPKSLLRHQLFLVLSVMLPLQLLLLTYTLHSRSIIFRQGEDMYTDYLGMVCTQSSGHLEHLANYISSLHYVNEDIAAMRRSTDSNRQYLLARQVTLSSETYLTLYPFELLFFILSDELSIPAVNTLSSGNNIALSEHLAYLKSIQDTSTEGVFIPEQIGNQRYLTLSFYKNGVRVGVFVSIDSILSALAIDNPALLTLTLEDTDGTTLSVRQFSTEENSAYSFSAAFLGFPLKLIASVGKDSLLGHLSILISLSAVILLVSVVGLLFFLFDLQKNLAHPLQAMTQIIQNIQGGNMESRIQAENEYMETMQVYTTFNLFMDHIEELKIAAYEEQLNRQQTELQYLQMQLRPHFFLNSLKSIYAMAETGETGHIKEYVLCLSEHYRFLLYNDNTLIPLIEELRHTQNYIRLQELGFHREIRCQIQTQAAMNHLPVPTLILQTFVENACKYAVRSDKTLSLTIICSLQEGENEVDTNTLCFSIYDNGPGFSADMLQEMMREEKEFFRHHKGFGNLRRRLNLLYKGNCYLYAYNLPEGGGAVDVMIPLCSGTVFPQKENEK